MAVLEHIQFDESIKTKKQSQIMALLKKEKPLVNYYLIIKVKPSVNSFEIVHSHEMYRHEKFGRQVWVLGITKDKDQAILMIQTWIESIVSREGIVTSNSIDEEFDIG